MNEKGLESLICDNPRALKSAELDTVHILGRQIKLSHGILDVLAVRHSDTLFILPEILVVELKAVPIKEKDVAQVGRYVYDVHRIISYILMDEPWVAYHPPRTAYRENLVENHYGYKSVPGKYMGVMGGTIPILIGKGIPNEKLLAAAYGVGVEIYEWVETENGIGFRLHEPDDYYDTPQLLPRWGVESITILREDLDRIIDYDVSQMLFRNILGAGEIYHVDIAEDDNER